MKIVVMAIVMFLSKSPLANELIVTNNKTLDPPLADISKDDCSVELGFKPTPISNQLQHAYLVSTTGDGKKTEIRSGPQVFLGSVANSGNPYNCKTGHAMGAVVPYIGTHGLLGKNTEGQNIFSPDGNVEKPTAWVKVNSSKQKTMCALSTCLMKMVALLTKDCKNYIVGIDWMRNSNTTISSAMAACGVENMKPAQVNAPGWGESWAGKD